MPIVPGGIFGSALASMQWQHEAKKKEDKALQLCLSRKPPAPSPPAQRKTCAQAASQVSQFKIPKQSKPQPAPPYLPSRAGWSKKPSALAAAPPTQPAQAAQARKKKRVAGYAAGSSPFSSSTCLAFERVPLPHPGRVQRAQLIKTKTIKISRVLVTLAVPPWRKAAALTGAGAVRSPLPCCPPRQKCTALPGGHITVRGYGVRPLSPLDARHGPGSQLHPRC